MKEVTYEEAVEFTKHSNGWLDPTVPNRQYQAIVRHELDDWLKMGHIPPYTVLCRLLSSHQLPSDSTLLDVGASSGYYKRVLQIGGVPYYYTGLDFSQHYADFAWETFHISDFIVNDAVNMKDVQDASFDIVVTGGCIMHILDYEKALDEVCRVARQQIVLHRTPVMPDAEVLVRYFIKQAYGVPVLELHFHPALLHRHMLNRGWVIKDLERVTWDDAKNEGQASYLYVKA